MFFFPLFLLRLIWKKLNQLTIYTETGQNPDSPQKTYVDRQTQNSWTCVDRQTQKSWTCVDRQTQNSWTCVDRQIQKSWTLGSRLFSVSTPKIRTMALLGQSAIKILIDIDKHIDYTNLKFLIPSLMQYVLVCVGTTRPLRCTCCTTFNQKDLIPALHSSQAAYTQLVW